MPRKKSAKKKETSVEALIATIENDSKDKIGDFGNKSYDAYYELLIHFENAEENDDQTIKILSTYWIDYIEKVWVELGVAYTLEKGDRFLDVDVYHNTIAHYKLLAESKFFKLEQTNKLPLFNKMGYAHELLSELLFNKNKRENLKLAIEYYQKAIASNPEKEANPNNALIRDKNTILSSKINFLNTQLSKITPAKRSCPFFHFTQSQIAAKNDELPVSGPPVKQRKLNEGEKLKLFSISHINKNTDDMNPTNYSNIKFDF